MRLHEAIAKGLTNVPRTSHSRRPSTSSRIDVDPDSDVQDDEEEPTQKLRKKVCHMYHRDATSVNVLNI